MAARPQSQREPNPGSGWVGLDWEEVFREYRATMDWPAAAFYEELMESYPDAKVILTVRDSERWYESARNTIYGIQKTATSPFFSLGALFVPRMRRMRRAALMAADLAWEGMFDGRFEDRRHAIEAFEQWNEEVKERVPPDKLLVYGVKKGWGPLCEFLEVEVPNGKPFPHLNGTKTFQKMIRRRLALIVAVPTVALSLAALALLRLCDRRRR